MAKPIKKIFLLLLLCFVIFLFGQICQAQTGSTDPTYTMQVPIPGVGQSATVNIAEWVKAIYLFGAAAIIVICIIAIIYAGVLWITMGGFMDKVDTAKKIIFSSLVGLAIALFAVIILRAINPATVDLKKLYVEPVSIDGTEQNNSGGSTGTCTPQCPSDYTCQNGSCYPNQQSNETICCQHGSDSAPYPIINPTHGCGSDTQVPCP